MIKIRMLLIVATLIGLSGCTYQVVSIKDIATATEKCANNDGVQDIIEWWDGTTVTVCKNLARFNI